jgi:hypothetical protein
MDTAAPGDAEERIDRLEEALMELIAAVQELAAHVPVLDGMRAHQAAQRAAHLLGHAAPGQ